VSVNYFFRMTHNIWLISLLLLANCAYGNSNLKNIYVVESGNSGHDSAYLHELRQFIYLEKLHRVNFDNLDREKIEKRNGVIITVGPKAFKSVVKEKITHPIIAINIYKIDYDNILSKAKYKIKATAIFQDPDPAEQMRLVKGLIGKGAKVGVILGTGEEKQAELLKSKATQVGLILEVEYATTANDLRKSLIRLLSRNVEAIYAVPNRSIYNPRKPIILTNVMLTAYKNGIPFVGFSEDFVRAGAVASIFYNPQHVAGRTSEILNKLRHTTKPIEPSRPRNFNIVVNQRVARRLNYYKKDPNDFLTSIRLRTSFLDSEFQFVFIYSDDGSKT